MVSETHRWNVERDGDDLLICEGDHEKHEGCTYARYVPATTHQRTLEALRDLVQAADKAVGHITGYGEASTARINLRAALARIKEAT